MTIEQRTMPASSLFPAGKAFVAGGSGGIGSAICLALAEAGCDVVLTYKRNRQKAEAVVSEVTTAGGRAQAVEVDLEDAAAVKSAIDAAASHEGGLHTVVYAMGPFVHLKFLSQVEPEEFRSYLLSDTFACFNLVHASIAHLRKTRGSVVAITTTAVSRWAPQDGLSAVPKSAINSLMTGLAREEGRFGIRANSVALGVIDAGMSLQAVKAGYIDEKYWQAMSRNVPLQRLGTAKEVADAVVFLASSRAGYTTGQVLHVDGGYPL